ncbi:MAG: hypothetical protein E3K37_06225 [Candidatus Kuenenia sp.]|nr:hypothetical protein [Candidatus Kuenenia hertensis]
MMFFLVIEMVLKPVRQGGKRQQAIGSTHSTEEIGIIVNFIGLLLFEDGANAVSVTQVQIIIYLSYISLS